MRFRIAIIVFLLLSVPLALRAQELPGPRLPAAGGQTRSLGQPGSRTWTFGLSLGLSDMAKETAGVGELRFGVFQEWLNPALGLGGPQGEVYARVVNARPSAGVRGRFVLPIVGLAVGADYNASENQFRGIFTYVHPLWRGGIFGEGSTLRVDFVSSPDRSLSVGFETSFLNRIPKGVTRPLFDMVKLEGSRFLATRDAARYPALDRDTALASARRRALHTARDAARNIQRLGVPWVDHTGAGGSDSDAGVRKRLEQLNRLTSPSDSGLNIDRETVRFHDAVDHAFSLAALEDGVSVRDTVSVGRQLGDQARASVLGEVIYPYNFTLGQVKEDDTTLGLDTFARGAFTTWLQKNRFRGTDTTRRAVALVFDALLEMVEEARAQTRREWGTSRFVWLPLQYGLRAEQHDTQAELDKIVEHATKQRFVTGNHVSYIVNEQFHYQLRRTILETRSYHVLWTHDFRGRDTTGRPDTRGFDQVLHSYLAALTARVSEYDSTGTFPTYIILLDEWFYEVNDGRLWMNLLEDPMRHEVHLSAKQGAPTDTLQHRLARQVVAMDDSLRIAQKRLRDAVDGSALLTAHRRQYGETWLHNLVKVHVNITNAPDPSFWSWNVVKGFPLPDGWMRDHRKIVFYDLSEADPYSGEAMLTGAGIGEHYSNRVWEDRSLLVRGPVNRRLKAAARDALMKQGMAAAEIPAVLQPESVMKETRDTTIRTAAANSPMMQLHNGTGFDTKEVSVAKAVLYTLSPAGSVIEIPDSIWNGTFWGSALIGAALRGCRVVVIAPARQNAPADAFGSMIRARELLTRLVVASQILSAPIRAAGGMIRVGIFNSTTPVTDIPTRLKVIELTLAKNPWLGELYPFLRSPDLHSIADGLTTPADTARPLLHLKANFFASAEAWDVMSSPAWIDVLKAYARHRMRQLSSGDSLLPGIDSSQVLGDSAYKRWLGDQSPADRTRMMFYTVMGSANQNDRSMVSDGEAAMVLSQWPAVVPYLDMLLLVGQSEWVSTPAQLDSLLPRHGALKTRVAHWFKHVF